MATFWGSPIQKWFAEIGVEELDWPAQSPGLNPIEHLTSNRPTSVHNLTNAFVAEWKQVSAAMFQHLVESLHRRVEAVNANKGGTNWSMYWQGNNVTLLIAETVRYQCYAYTV